nr:DUF4166 domain-containing protein [Sphingomonas sp.]
MQVKTGAAILPFPTRRRPNSLEALGDLRFRALVGESGWAALPEATRRRFGKRVADCGTVLYAGEVVECEMSRAGWLLAYFARLIGAPLPLSRDVEVPAVVSVTEDAVCGGQFWTRMYGRHRGFPQVIHSSKRFAGPTGLEEYIGCGFGIALRVEVAGEELHFVSDHYFFALAGLRLKISRWLAPGNLLIRHVDCGHGWFAFTLELRHRLLGELIRQAAMFHDIEAPR